MLVKKYQKSTSAKKKTSPMLATKILTNVGQKIVMIDADQKPPRRCRPKNITN